MPEPSASDARVALVTGAARGIGRATAHHLARRGLRVVVADVNDAGAAAVVEEITTDGGTAIAVAADVTDADQVQAMVTAAEEQLGGVDVLVNNAGGALPGAQWAPVAETSLKDWDSFLALNLTGPFLCAKAVLPGMLERGRGHLVGVGSISGTNGQRQGAAYAAAKAGLVALVSSIAKEYGSRGISSNGIIVGNAPFPTRSEQRQRELDREVHLGRVGAYEEFARVIGFLCFEESSYLSGAMVPVDGGFHRSNAL